MSLSVFMSPAVLRRDLQILGYDMGRDEVSMSSDETLRDVLYFLADIVDPDNAPKPESSASDLREFWEALGLPSIEFEDELQSAAPKQSKSDNRRSSRHVALLRSAIDLALAAHGKSYPSNCEILPDDVEHDSIRETLVEQLYDIFPRSLPKYPEPKFKPKRKRTGQSSCDSNPGKNAEPMVVLRELTKAVRNLENTVQSTSAVSDNRCDGQAHSRLLDAAEKEFSYDGSVPNYPSDHDIDKLQQACQSASVSARLYQKMISGALTLPTSSTAVLRRDFVAESIVDGEIRLARHAQVSVTGLLKLIRRIEGAYLRLHKLHAVEIQNLQTQPRSFHALVERADQCKARLSRILTGSSGFRMSHERFISRLEGNI